MSLRRGFELDPDFADAYLRSDHVRETLQEYVDDAAEVAARLAPDDPRTITNDLHSSVFGDVAMTSHGWRGRVGASNFKAPWFEEGAAGVASQPFLRPAVEQTVGPIEAHPDDDEE